MFWHTFLGSKAPTSLSADLENEKIKYRDLNIQLESDKNESDLALSESFVLELVIVTIKKKLIYYTKFNF